MKESQRVPKEDQHPTVRKEGVFGAGVFSTVTAEGSATGRAFREPIKGSPRTFG